MSTSYREKVLADYKKKKAESLLSINLSHPTAASIRNECIAVFETRYKKKDESVVKYLVGEKSSPAEYLIALKILEADDVKSLSNYLQGRTGDTGNKNIELLAWLIDYEPRPHPYNFEVSSSAAKPQKTFLATAAPKRKKLYWLIPIIAIITGAVIYWLTGQNPKAKPINTFDAGDRIKGCMFWTGEHYQKTPCDIKRGDTLIVGRDDNKLQHFRKLMITDTITSNSLGKLWYSKIDGNVEFFTASGFHPIHVERRLHPVTQYMINKYAHK
ncbi:unnamed protein product [Sphagnum tenellum]